MEAVFLRNVGSSIGQHSTQSEICVRQVSSESWSLKLREEHRLRVLENRVLGRVFVARRDEVTGEWRKLHNEELRKLILFATHT
jgi:hypothetical protein